MYVILLLHFFFFFFGHTRWHVGSQFPDQGSNPCSRPLSIGSTVLTSVLPEKFLLLHIFLGLFLSFWLHWVFLLEPRLALVEGATLCLQCMGFSLQWPFLLGSIGSRCMGFSGCSTWAQLLCGIWDLPGPGIEVVSCALAGGLSATGPPEKFLVASFEIYSLVIYPDVKISPSFELPGISPFPNFALFFFLFVLHSHHSFIP